MRFIDPPKIFRSSVTLPQWYPNVVRDEMKRVRFNDELIIRVLREKDKNMVVEVAKRHGVSGYYPKTAN